MYDKLKIELSKGKTTSLLDKFDVNSLNAEKKITLFYAIIT